MNTFTIAQLAQFSGIKAHTIRMWEQRYEVLSPNRSQGNTRIYSNSDLRRLLNIGSLLDSGHKVAELCRMPDETLDAQLKQKYGLENKQHPNHFVSQLLAAGIDFDEASFQKTLSHCLLRFGVNATYKDIIYPLLKRVGLLWTTDMLPPAHEHFMSNLIRQKLLTAIDSLPSPKADSKKWLLFLPEDEFHETGLLFAQYILRTNGFNTYYLGANVPLKTLDAAIDAIVPEALLLFFVHHNLPENVESYLKDVSSRFPKKIYICGNEKLISDVGLPPEMHWLKEINSLQADLRSQLV